MNKEQILEKARIEKNDEGISNAKNKGLSLGFKIFMALIIFIISLNLITGKNSYSVITLFWSFMFSESYSRYKFSKEKIDFISTIGSAIACIGFLINYILYTLG